MQMRASERHALDAAVLASILLHAVLLSALPGSLHAVLDALDSRGAARLEMPFTPEKVWRALQGSGQLP